MKRSFAQDSPPTSVEEVALEIEIEEDDDDEKGMDVEDEGDEDDEQGELPSEEDDTSSLGGSDSGLEEAED